MVQTQSTSKARGLSYLLLIVLISWAAFSLLARHLLSDISIYTPKIQALVEEKTPYRVSISQLEGRWVIFSPLIELKDIVLFQHSITDSNDVSSASFNSDENAILKISHLAIELDIIESIFTLSPRIKRLLLNGVDVNIIQDPETQKISIKGMVEDSNLKNNTRELVQKILNDFILSSEQIYLKNIRIGLNLNTIKDGQLIIESLNLDNEWFNHEIETRITLHEGDGVHGSGEERRLRFFSVFQGNPLDISNLSAKCFVELEKTELGFWLKPLNIPSVAITNAALESQMWFDINQGILDDVKLSINAADINLQNKILSNEMAPVVAETKYKSVQIQSLDFLLHLQAQLELSKLTDRQYLSSLQNQHAILKIRNLDIDWDDFHLNNVSALAEQVFVEKLNSPLEKEWGAFKEQAYQLDVENKLQHGNTRLYRGVLSHIPLGFIKKVSPFISVLESKQTLINEASPQGALKGIQVLAYVGNDSAPEIYASTYAKNIGISSLAKIPSISGIDFYAELAPQGLGIELFTEDAQVEEDFYLFRKDLEVTKLEGNLFLERLSGDIVAHSDIVELENDWVSASAILSLSIPDRFYSDGTKEIPAWSIQVGFKTIPAVDSLMFFPGKLPPAFLTWLDNFILEGSVEGDIMLFAFAKKREPDTFALLDGDLKVEGLKLDYLPGKWPQLSDVKGQILVHNDQVKANIPAARMFDTRLYNASVFIPSYLNENLPRVKVQGNVSGSLQDVQKLFLESELKYSLGTVVEDWVLHGEQNASVNIDLPISDSPNNYESKLEVGLSVSDALIAVPSVGLGVKELKGDIHYSLAKGLVTEEITAKFFDKEVQGHIETKDPEGNQVIQIFAKGNIESQDLSAWQDFWVFDNLQGSASFDAIIAVGEEKAIELVLPTIGISGEVGVNQAMNIVIDKKKSKTKQSKETPIEVIGGIEQVPEITQASILRVEVRSDLKNLAVNLPGDYAKDKEETIATRLQLDVLPESMIYRLNYGGMIGVSAKTEGENLERARINFGDGPFPLPLASGISVTGHIENLDYDAWLAYFEKNLFDEDLEQNTTSATAFGKEIPLNPDNNFENVSNREESTNDEKYDPASVLNHMDVSIAHFFGFDQTLKNLKVFVTREPFLWRLEIENEVLSGLVFVPDEELISKDNPIVAKLKYLKITEEQFATKESANTDPVNASGNQIADSDLSLSEDKNTSAEGLNPADFSFMKLDIDNVTIDKTKHGRWQLDIFPDENGVDFKVHQLNYGLMAINGAGRWDYRDDYSMTRFKGHLRTSAVTKIFSALSLRPSSNSKGLMAIDIRWPGSPFDFDSETMKGTAGLEIFDGSIVEVDINSKKFKALGIFNLGIITDVLTLKIFKKIGKRIEDAVSDDEN